MSPICSINDITDPGAKGILHNGVAFMVIKKMINFMCMKIAALIKELHSNGNLISF